MIPVTLLLLNLTVSAMQAQTFETVSVRLSKPETQPHFSMENGRLTAEGLSLSAYIMSAWNLMLSRDQLDAMRARLPKWASTETFEIRAVAPGSPTQDQMRLMLQSLLADRFSLKVHFDTAQTPVLALVLDKPGKTGSNLRPHSEGPPCDVHNADVFPPMCDQLLASDRPNHAVLVGARNMTIGQIGAFVSSLGRLDRPVVDQTSLSGNFDFTLEFTNHPQPDAEGTTLQEALQDQLGLKLKTATAPLNTLVVDHVERPSEN
jgi:uncharacterized protein (TIGR03435 family)